MSGRQRSELRLTLARHLAWAGLFLVPGCGEPSAPEHSLPHPDDLPTACSDPGGLVHSGSIGNATWRAEHGPHRVVNEWVPPYGPVVRLEVSGHLVIEPGTLVCFDDEAAGLFILDDATLTAEGTTELPILFKSGVLGRSLVSWQILVRGHAVMSDVSFDGGLVRAVERDEEGNVDSGRLEARGVTFTSGSGIEAADATITNAVVESGCTPVCSYGPAVSLREGFTLDGLYVTDAVNAGIQIFGSGIIRNCEVTGSRQDGVAIYSTGLQISRCNLFGNGGVALRNLGEEPVDARNNWWGDAEGPFGPEGNRVEGNVLYEPWLTEPVPAPARR